MKTVNAYGDSCINVYATSDKTSYYSYSFVSQSAKFYCTGCQNDSWGTIEHDASGNEYLLLRGPGHTCLPCWRLLTTVEPVVSPAPPVLKKIKEVKPRQTSSTIDKENPANVIRAGHFAFEDGPRTGIKNGKLIVYATMDKSLYHALNYHSGNNLYKCNKTQGCCFTAKWYVDVNGQEYLRGSQTTHKCFPVNCNE